MLLLVLLYTAPPALLVTLLLVGRWGWRTQALALVATALAVGIVLDGLPQWPWHVGREDLEAWLLWIVVGSGLVGAVRDLRLVPPRLGDVLAWAGLAAFGGFVIGMMRRQQPWEVLLAALGAGWLVLGFVHAALRTGAAQNAGAGGVLGAAVVLLGDALVAPSPILFAGAIALVAAAVVGRWRPPVQLSEGASLVVTAAHGLVPLLWLAGVNQPRGNTLQDALLLGLGPVLLLLALRRVVVRQRSFGHPALVALGSCWWALTVLGFVFRPNLL